MYAQGELAGARKLEEQLLEALASDMEAHGGGGELGELHKFTSDGETQVKPCAEAWLSERTADAILSHGIVPVLSVHGRDAVQLLTLEALSNPPMRPWPCVWNSRGKSKT